MSAFFFGPGQPRKGLTGPANAVICLKPPTTMRDISAAVPFFLISCGMSLLVGASFMRTPPPAKDALAYDKCTNYTRKGIAPSHIWELSNLSPWHNC
jgi:hypothetical protein